MADIAKKVPVNRKGAAPDESMLKEMLGEGYAWYCEILPALEYCSREWKYYGEKHGWQLKVAHKGKALLYLVPQEKSFRLGLALREPEKEALMNFKLPAAIREELKMAKKYPEGYPLRLPVSKAGDMKAVHIVLDALKSSRS